MHSATIYSSTAIGKPCAAGTGVYNLRFGSASCSENTIEHAGIDVTVVVGGISEDANGFYIEDDGLGIPAEDRDKVFEAGHSTSESGTGLGLSVVKRVADAHDWNIRVTESSMGGTRFESTGLEVIE
ncbi:MULTISPECIES: HAMP domain-containing sensor histidine kinase [unclassified Haloarcula]|uniref:sensor histidine kinase n=1 Tax=unclassified Haloarcula TaxID=2624677 RepID=UPI001CDA0171|nr:MULTISPECIES: sensor histidine kinase [unclassified Haloarcula]